MNVCARCFGLLVLLGLTVPVFLAAQEKADDKPPADKKDDKKDEKKDAKKDDAKDPKGDEKPEPKKKAKAEPEEKVVYGQMITAKIRKLDPNSNRDFTIEVPNLDPMKVASFQQWQAEQLFQISQIQPKDFKERANRLYRYQLELPRKQNDVYSPKEVNFRAGENAKIRSLYPPVEYDDRGFLKKWTAKELLALKGASKLPGYPSALDNLRVGQTVQLYLPKSAAPVPVPKGTLPKKKIIIEEGEQGSDRFEAVMIVITLEAASK